MLNPEKIDRINVLARKKKEGTLTEAEAAEQAALRAEYLDNLRKSFREQLDSIKFVEDEEGYEH
ncbi:MAG: DUF896 domain-containing protein [Tumebacillaceae bacterium]